MLAIFGKSVATCPDTIKVTDEQPSNYSALKDGALPGYFSSVHSRTFIRNVDSSVVFAYSPLKPPHLRRTVTGHVADVICMFQGEMKDVDMLKKRYSLPDEANEISILVTIFQILREVGQEAPKSALRDMMGDFSFIIYDNISKCVMSTSDNSHEFPLFWGLDSEHSLVISDGEGIVAKACPSTAQKFPKGEVYISCRGNAGLEAIFMDYTPEEENWYQQMQSDLDRLIEQLRITESPLLPTTTSWKPPSSADVFKINTKGLVFTEDNSIGIGVTIRNWRGQIQMALSKKIKGFTRSIHAEELAIIEGLRMAHTGGLRHVLCEPSCLNLWWINPHGAYYMLLMSIRSALLARFSSSEFHIVDDDANKAAHGLAKYAKEIDDCVVWHNETPPCIADILLMESNTGANN